VKTFEVVSVNISAAKGTVKRPVRRIVVRRDYGVDGDAHAGGARQVSLLDAGEIASAAGEGASFSPGDFGENITTGGVALHLLPIGAVLKINSVVLEITGVGKACHHGCAIRRRTGNCIMPSRGVFAKVLEGGEISHGDTGYYDF
jgi:MOSC domain-containing protein YiiM